MQTCISDSKCDTILGPPPKTTEVPAYTCRTFCTCTYNIKCALLLYYHSDIMDYNGCPVPTLGLMTVKTSLYMLCILHKHENNQ